ncbi:hypothetical protein HGRIS_013872 [Hohenbuehelia grisea]|uniref:Uncharacterized protein n=1 Tax=Hohenbuehelia grisea TaxID=104357 RepID=A0ABR3IX31_9AGAR
MVQTRSSPPSSSTVATFSSSYFTPSIGVESTFHPLGVWFPANMPPTASCENNSFGQKRPHQLTPENAARLVTPGSTEPKYNTWGTPRSSAILWRVEVTPVEPTQPDLLTSPSHPPHPSKSHLMASPAARPRSASSPSSMHVSTSTDIIASRRPTPYRPRSTSPASSEAKDEHHARAKLVAGLLLRRRSAPTGRSRRRSASASAASASPYVRSSLRAVASADD